MLSNFKMMAASVAQLLIMDAIGSQKDGTGISSGEVASMIQNNPGIGTLNVSINSPGGFLSDGLAIYNLLKSSAARVIVTIEGIAASAASLIAMAGDEIRMPAGALMMIHNPTVSASGGRKEMETNAQAWDRMTESSAGIYASRSGQSVAKVKKMMDAETWMSATEAKSLGFCTSIINGSGLATMTADTAKMLAHYRNVPSSVKAIHPNCFSSVIRMQADRQPKTKRPDNPTCLADLIVMK